MRNPLNLCLGTALMCVLLLAGSPAHAWGPLGHRIVAETGALLMKQQSDSLWGDLMARHRFELGVYSFYPDSQFRHADGHQGKEEAPTHFFDIDLLVQGAPLTEETRAKIQAVPTDFESAGKYLKKQNAKTEWKDIGTAPWRVSQLLALAGKELAQTRKAEGGYTRGATAEKDARHLYLALYYLGLMAHYTGDSTMPFHGSSDWNGYSSGQGGIHFYFEGDCVNAFEPGLSDEVLKSATKNQARWLGSWFGKDPSKGHTITQMLVVLSESYSRIPELLKLDRKYAVTKLAPAGSEKFALRKPPGQGCKNLRPLLVERLAKGAVLTAHFWTAAFKRSPATAVSPLLQFSDFQSASYIQPQYDELGGQTVYPSATPVSK